MKITYDTEPCTRCGGTGEYSWNSMTGSRCFKCNGRTVQFTAAARRARKVVEAWKEEHATVAASSLRPGDKIIGRSGRAFTVTEVETTLGPPEEGRSFGTTRIGDATYCNLGRTVYRYGSGDSVACAAHWPVKRALTRADMEALVAFLGKRRKGFTVTD